MLNFLSNEVFSWFSWLVIPIIIEIIPAFLNFLILIKKSLRKKDKELDFLPQISLLIPVYNSSVTLAGCIQSVNDSNYPNNLIDVLLIDNKSKDNSFEIFKECQEKFPTLNMQWLNANQGKSKALNLALFNTNGKYIINIDSDGKLEKNALYNIVKKFENHENIHCMTGSIITEPALIEATPKKSLRALQKLEFLEYCNAFLVGRNYLSERNNIFSLSGAFSAFRKSTILKTQLYNTNTICEDAHLTFQVKQQLNQKVALCEDAIFMVDPIETLTKLYTQRQRWQIGELEVLHMFNTKKTLRYRNIFKDPNIRLTIIDHTFAFPRLIWYFVLLALGFYKYNMLIIAEAMLAMYLMYALIGYLNYIASLIYLKPFKEIKKYYAKKFIHMFFLPLYSTLTFFIRTAGIINSINRESSWKTLNYKEEFNLVKETIKSDFSLKKEKKEKGKMNKKSAIIYALIVFLVFNIFSAIYLMNQNIQNNYKNYSLTQEQVLYSIVNTTNRDIDIIASAMQLSKMTGNQNFYIYNQTDDVFEIYCDKEENINDTFIKNALINNETICVDYENNEKVLSSIQIKIKDKNYCLGLATNTEYINNNYNNSMYNMFIILEFVILYVILIIISLALYGIDKRYKTKIEQINNNLKEYENKIDLNTDAKGNISAKEQKTYTEGVYDVSFYEKLKKKLIDNNIAFNIAKYEIKESLEDKIVEMLKDKNAYLVKDFNNYIVLSINDKDICMNEIINLGGKYVG